MKTEIEIRLQRELSEHPPQPMVIEGFSPAAVLVPLLISETGHELLFTVP